MAGTVCTAIAIFDTILLLLANDVAIAVGTYRRISTRTDVSSNIEIEQRLWRGKKSNFIVHLIKYL